MVHLSTLHSSLCTCSQRTKLTSDVSRPVRAESDFFSSSLRLMHVDLPDHSLPYLERQGGGFVGVVFIDGFVQPGVVLLVVLFRDLGRFILFGPDGVRLAVHIVQHRFPHPWLDPVHCGILPVGSFDVRQHIGHFRAEMDQKQRTGRIGIFHGPPAVFHRLGRPQHLLHLALGNAGTHPRHPGLAWVDGTADGNGSQIGHDLRLPGQGRSPNRQRKQQTPGQKPPGDPSFFQHHG